MAQVIELPGVREGRGRCQAMTSSGRRCRNKAIGETGFCRVHLPEAPERIGPFSADSIRDALEFVRRRMTGEYEVDAFGFDRELTEKVFLPMVRPLVKRYFRVEWKGLENVPSDGSALLVSNHAGTVPMDAVIVKFGLLDEHPAHRHVRLLAADLAFRMPFMGPLARKTGNSLATPDDSHRLLSDGELLGVFPEGYKGVGKPFRERYHLQRFGRGGFIELALRARAPLVPVSIVGSEEIYPKIGDLKLLARLFNLPYFPVTPTFPWLGPLGVVPLPSKWRIEFGEPIRTDHLGSDSADDRARVFELSELVRDEVQRMVYENLVRRGSAFI